MQRPWKATPTTGFTLIELMITLVIISILAAVAYPLYTTQVQKSHRSAAQTSLMELAGRQASWRSTRTSYGSMSDIIGLNPSIADPSDSYYLFAVTAGTTTFTISAVPQGSQLGDGCGTLSLSQNLTGTPSSCW